MEGPLTEPANTVTEKPAEAAAPPKKRMKRSTRLALIVIVVLALAATGLFVARYITDTRNFVSTDNAQIDGNQISVNAPATGTLLDWRGTQGAELVRDMSVGRIRMQGGFVQPQMIIRAPADGIVSVDNGIEGSFVTQGTQLAIAYDSAGIFVTARVDETDIDDVAAGQRVEIAVDAFPDAELTGSVIEVQGGAAGVFSLFPQANTSGNFQKVTQVIPVKIRLDDTQNLNLVPGMNVTVKIARR